MGEFKIRNLDPQVAAVLRTRAKTRGVSMEEEARSALTESVALKREAFARRAAACRASTRRPKGRPVSDSAVLIRRERDAWG
jgi:plasmid stability protein